MDRNFCFLIQLEVDRFTVTVHFLRDYAAVTRGPEPEGILVRRCNARAVALVTTWRRARRIRSLRVWTIRKTRRSPRKREKRKTPAARQR
jgi:hypothetical protein